MTLYLNHLRRVQYIALLLGMGIMLALSMAPTAAHAAATASKPTCTGHDIHLNGSQPATTTCWQMSTSGKTVTPNTTWDHCTNSDARLEIISSSSGSYCFYGAGYIGLSPNIFIVTTVKSLRYQDWIGNYVYGSGWVLYYYYPWTAGTGQKFYFGNGSTYNCSNSAFCSGNQIKITQVDLNS